MDKETIIQDIQKIFKEIILDNDLLFEYDLIKIIKKKNIKIFNELKFNSNPEYIRVKKIELITRSSSMINPLEFTLLKRYNDNSEFIEICFVTNIPILEIYYKILNIPYENLSKDIDKIFSYSLLKVKKYFEN